MREQQRVAIKDQDIVESLSKLGFDHYVPCLEALVKRIAQSNEETLRMQEYVEIDESMSYSSELRLPAGIPNNNLNYKNFKMESQNKSNKRMKVAEDEYCF